jgi:hypothetical protein
MASAGLCYLRGLSAEYQCCYRMFVAVVAYAPLALWPLLGRQFRLCLAA